MPHYITNMSKQDFESISAGFILSGLEKIIKAHGQASLFLSGGSTPIPIYEKLSQTHFHWGNVNIGLVDDRWVPENDAGSNAGLIHRSLLKNAINNDHFISLKTTHKTAELGQSIAEEKYKMLFKKPSLAVIGMGTDGHVCSWFPEAQGLREATDPQNKNHLQAITAYPSKVTGLYLERMTLTLHALCECDKVLLLISGADKKRVLDKAMDSNAELYPISFLLNAMRMKAKNPLTILHAA